MTNYVILFGIRFNINPVAFTLPIGSGWSVYWYGIIIAVGFLAAVVYGYFMAKKLDIDIDRMLDVILVTTPVAILCARAYYIIFDDYKINSIKEFFGFGGSGFAGLAIYGGVIGAFACGFLMCKLRKLNVLDMFDLAAVGFILAQGIGRWGNFFNQEAYGIATGSTWWGMTGNVIAQKMGTDLVHPCFLYESVWCILGFFVLHYVIRHRKFKGQTVLAYCIWYGFQRGFLELIRTDSLMLGPVRISSLLSFVLCIAGIVTMICVLRKQKTQVADSEYQPLFAEEAASNLAELSEDTVGEPQKDANKEIILEAEEELTDDKVD